MWDGGWVLSSGRRGVVDRKLRQDNAGVRAWKHQLQKHGDSMIKVSEQGAREGGRGCVVGAWQRAECC